VLRPLPLQIDASLPQPSSLDAARRHVKKLREDLQEQAPAWGRAFQRYDELDTRRTTLHLVHMLGRANISVPPESVALKDTSSAAVAREKARVDQKLAVDDKKLTPAEALAAARISRTLAALKAEDAPERIPEAAFLLEETDKLLRALQTLGRQIDAVVEVRDAFRGLTVLVENAQESENPAVATTAVSEMRILQRRLKAVYDSIGGVPYPFAKAGEKREMRHYLFSPLARLQSSDNSFEVAADVLDRYGTIYQRIMGQLCVVVEQIEAQMGLTPLPEPKDAEEDDEDEAQARTS
jgi:hypothetical protein